MPNSHDWPPPWLPRPDTGHSTKEVEHRFTSLEAHAEQTEEDQADLHKIVSKHGEKLTTHERILLALIIGLSTLLQERWPHVAVLIKALTGS